MCWLRAIHPSIAPDQLPFRRHRPLPCGRDCPDTTRQHEIPQAVLGAPVVMPPAGVPDDPDETTSTCIYVQQSKGSSGVMVSLGAPGASDPIGSRPLTQAAKGTALQPLSGIGDEAVTDGKHIVITRKNGYQLAVIVGSETIGDPSNLETGKRLARIGADRL